MRLPDQRRARAIVSGEDRDPFSYLGMHETAAGLVVRCFFPGSRKVGVLRADDGRHVANLRQIHTEGLFAGHVPGGERFAYRLHVAYADAEKIVADPYSYDPLQSPQDIYLHAEGSYFRSFDKMGAHPITVGGVAGTSFAVWAPNAWRVSVVGDFNQWDGRVHPMRFHPGAGIWEIFLPGVEQGALYKFEIRTSSGAVQLKADPYAFRAELPPRTASIVAGLPQRRGESKRVSTARNFPVSIYEVHLGSWLRKRGGSQYLNYRELADVLIPYVKHMGFTHIELMPVMEHPFGGSWGYQPTSLFAPTSRYGAPQEFETFVDKCHADGIGVLLDWVPAHFPDDPHGLVRFDGTALYEHEDRREGHHPDWNTLIYNFGRREVCNFLLSNALYWIEDFGVDGLRLDAVASMLYRNYSRKEGEWIANVHGGPENLEVLVFLRKLNELVFGRCPDATTIAEDSTAWPMVSRPVYLGGLGFGYKWNMGWMHDTLSFMSKDPIHRKYHLNELTFGLLYAFSENFILPLSHDEVVHQKGSLLEKMPGDRWQKFANLRAYYAFMFTQPGKKLLFMGNEFAQPREWSHDRGLDWEVTSDPLHGGLQTLVRDLNLLYRTKRALHELDCESEGFLWIDCSDTENSVIAYLRKAASANDFVVVVCNFTPVVRHRYCIGVPLAGQYRECLNTDSMYYGGSNVGNLGDVIADGSPSHGFPHSLTLTLPPLATIVLQPAGAAS